MEEKKMNTANINSNPEGTGESTDEKKMFTQEEVNRIVSERLQREKAKAEPSEQETREADLTRRENRMTCREFLIENNYMSELLDILDTSDVDKFKEAVTKLSNILPGIEVGKPVPRFTTPMKSGISKSDPIANAFKLK